jgi:hypothetical protein
MGKKGKKKKEETFETRSFLRVPRPRGRYQGVPGCGKAGVVLALTEAGEAS